MDISVTLILSVMALANKGSHMHKPHPNVLLLCLFFFNCMTTMK